MTGIVGIFGTIALWLACQVPVALLLGRCLRRASEHDFREAETARRKVVHFRAKRPRRPLCYSDATVAGTSLALRAYAEIDDQHDRETSWQQGTEATVRPVGIDW